MRRFKFLLAGALEIQLKRGSAMSIRINKNARKDVDREAIAREFELFLSNAQIIMEHQEEILGCKDYFFVPLAFAGCSFAYVGGGGPLCLGYLLLGWSDGILIELCTTCGEQVRVVSFGGSPLSGSTAWSGFCVNCSKEKSGRGSIHTPFFKKIEFVMKLRKAVPLRVYGWVEEDHPKFSWGGNGLEASRRKIWRGEATAKPITLETLIEELKSGNLRKPNRLKVSLLRNKMVLEFWTKSGATVRISPDDTR
jgi:hypothetical protein